MFSNTKDAGARRAAARKLTAIVSPMGSCVVNIASAEIVSTAKE